LLNNTNTGRVGVLGAGIQGCCLALELAQRGYAVDLIDIANQPVTGASLHNEGKLHLGFVYANDPGRKTHQTMLQGALSFARIIKKLTGAGPEVYMNPEPFQYFVPVESGLSMAMIEEHFQTVEATAHELTRSTGDRYLGLNPGQYFNVNSAAKHQRMFCADTTLGSFRTQERSVSPAIVAKLLSRAIHSHPDITFIGGTSVVAIDHISDDQTSVEVCSKTSGELAVLHYPCVANCLWDDKTRVDSTAGFNRSGPWIHRFKVTIQVVAATHRHGHIPSATGIHGPFGDVVNTADNDFYISWYPLCKINQTTGPNGRNLHKTIHPAGTSRGVRKIASVFPWIASFIASKAHRKFIRENILQMARYVPAIGELTKFAAQGKLGGGVIVARGCSDIDNPGSQLHQRLPVGPVAHHSYLTVDTGKYTMAPLYALQSADMAEELLR